MGETDLLFDESSDAPNIPEVLPLTTPHMIDRAPQRRQGCFVVLAFSPNSDDERLGIFLQGRHSRDSSVQPAMDQVQPDRPDVVLSSGWAVG